MKDIAGEGFGNIIAFLLPGYLFLIGIQIFEPVELNGLMNLVNAPTGVRGVLYLSLVGLLISGARWAIYDRFLLKFLKIKLEVSDWSKLNDPEVHKSFMMVSDQHFNITCIFQIVL